MLIVENAREKGELEEKRGRGAKRPKNGDDNVIMIKTKD